MGGIRSIGFMGALIGLTVGAAVTSSWAVDAPPVTVTAEVTVREEIGLIRDPQSVSRFSATDIVFDRFDDQDGQPDGDPTFMYAPYRSEAGANWHLLDLLSNGSTFTITAAVTGDVNGTPLANIMDAFFGGFFGNNGSFSGGASSDWELLDTFTRTLAQPFFGTGPLSYRLRLDGVVGNPTAATGVVLYSLVSS